MWPKRREREPPQTPAVRSGLTAPEKAIADLLRMKAMADPHAYIELSLFEDRDGGTFIHKLRFTYAEALRMLEARGAG